MPLSSNKIRYFQLLATWLILLAPWLTACGDPTSRPSSVVTATPVAQPTIIEASPKPSLAVTARPTSSLPPTTPPKIQGWYSTGLRLVKDGQVCFDKTQPNIAFVSTPRGVFSYDWTTDKATQLSVYPILACGLKNNLLFTVDPASHQVYRLQTGLAPAEEPISHLPTVVAHDGTAQVYSLQANGEDADFKLNRLYYSSDGGQTWQERGQQFGGRVLSIMADGAAAAQVYAMVAGDPLPKNYLATLSAIPHHFSIYASHDSGLSWEKRFESQTNPANGTYASGSPSFPTLLNQNPPSPGTVLYSISSGGSPSSARETYNLSTDGGYTFSPVGVGGGSPYYGLFQLFQTSQGWLRRQTGAYNDSGYSISRDSGKSWQILNKTNALGGVLWQAPAEPNTFFISGTELAQSKDATQHWQILSNQAIKLVGISLYSPITLLGIDSASQLYWFYPGL